MRKRWVLLYRTLNPRTSIISNKGISGVEKGLIMYEIIGFYKNRFINMKISVRNADIEKLNKVLRGNFYGIARGIK